MADGRRQMAAAYGTSVVLLPSAICHLRSSKLRRAAAGVDATHHGGAGAKHCGGIVARYTDPVCRLCRREGMKLFLKGDRCFKDKCAIERRNYAPGQHGRRRSKVLGYG